MAFSPTSGPRPQTGSGQIAELHARLSRPGFSKDPSDYMPRRVRLSSEAYDPMAPGFRPEVDPAGFLLENDPTTRPACLASSLAPCAASRRSTASPSTAKPTTQRFMIWKKQPDVEPIKGKGGGLKTARGGWIKGRYDEIFLLIANRLCCITLWNAHGVITALQQQAMPLPIGALFEARWQLTKVERPDGEDQAGNQYFRREPHFELLGIAGQTGRAERSRACAREKALASDQPVVTSAS